jgi:hypothetical protein
MSNTNRTLGPNRKPPSLMDLVTRFGGYDKITREAWADYDREMKDYRADLASGALWEPAEDPPEEETRS